MGGGTEENPTTADPAPCISNMEIQLLRTEDYPSKLNEAELYYTV